MERIKLLQFVKARVRISAISQKIRPRTPKKELEARDLHPGIYVLGESRSVGLVASERSFICGLPRVWCMSGDTSEN